MPHQQVERYYERDRRAGLSAQAYARSPTSVTPLKPLEAMAQRRLVAASDVGGHRELIRDGDTGTLFRPDDPGALAERVARLFARAPRMGRAAGSAARAFVEAERNWAINVARYRLRLPKISPKSSPWKTRGRTAHGERMNLPSGAFDRRGCSARLVALGVAMMPMPVLEALVMDSAGFPPFSPGPSHRWAPLRARVGGTGHGGVRRRCSCGLGASSCSARAG